MSAPLRWYFDFISPFAYLQWRRLRSDHADIALNPKPVLLAAILNHVGQLGPAEIPQKRRHTYRIVLWQARQAGIPLRFPPAHPFNPLPALRLCLAAPDRPQPRAEVISRLHAHVQDVFNEHGVQIMSPHYFGDPDDAKVVPPARWFEAPAKPPGAGTAA